MISLAFDIGTKNLGVAACSSNAAGESTLIWLDTADISAKTADRCVVRLWEYLDAMLLMFPEHSNMTVLIEAQPSKARSLMRSVELGVRHYFMLRNHQKLDKVHVKSVSPRSKLESAVKYAPGSSSAQRYKARKDASVQEVRTAFKHLPEALGLLECGKADDACDATLYLIRDGAVNFVSIAPEALCRHHEKETLKEAAVRDKAAAKEAAVRDKAAAKEAAVRDKAAAKEAAKMEKEAAKVAAKMEKEAAKMEGHVAAK
jgi:histone H1/5